MAEAVPREDGDVKPGQRALQRYFPEASHVQTLKLLLNRLHQGSTDRRASTAVCKGRCFGKVGQDLRRHPCYPRL